MKNEIQPKGVTSQVVLGILVIAMGLLFLLDNFDILDMHRAVSFWPMVFIIAGTVKLCDTRTQGGTLMGAGLVALGILLMLDRMDVIDFSWRVLWPVVLIAFGGFLLYKAVTGRRRIGGLAGMLKDAPDQEVVDLMAIIGAQNRRVTTPHFRGGEITAFMGGVDLDLRQASLDHEAVITVFAFWGGVVIKCPVDWTIVMEGTPVMGGFEDKTAPTPNSGKRLVVRGYAIMGGVEVRN